MLLEAIDPQYIISQSSGLNESSGKSSVAEMNEWDIEPGTLNNESMYRLSAQRPVRNANSMTLKDTLVQTKTTTDKV